MGKRRFARGHQNHQAKCKSGESGFQLVGLRDRKDASPGELPVANSKGGCAAL